MLQIYTAKKKPLCLLSRIFDTSTNLKLKTLVWFLEAQCQTKESCRSILGSSEQSPMLVGPESVAIKSEKTSISIRANVHWLTTEELKCYRERRWSWTPFIKVILRISQLWWHYNPARLLNRLQMSHIHSKINTHMHLAFYIQFISLNFATSCFGSNCIELFQTCQRAHNLISVKKSYIKDFSTC